MSSNLKWDSRDGRGQRLLQGRERQRRGDGGDFVSTRESGTVRGGGRRRTMMDDLMMRLLSVSNLIWI